MDGEQVVPGLMSGCALSRRSSVLIATVSRGGQNRVLEAQHGRLSSRRKRVFEGSDGFRSIRDKHGKLVNNPCRRFRPGCGSGHGLTTNPSHTFRVRRPAKMPTLRRCVEQGSRCVGPAWHRRSGRDPSSGLRRPRLAGFAQSVGIMTSLRATVVTTTLCGFLSFRCR